VAMPSRHVRVLANSRHVAEVFGKRHDNVLVAVDNLDCSDEFRLLNFKETCENQGDRCFAPVSPSLRHDERMSKGLEALICPRLQCGYIAPVA